MPAVLPETTIQTTVKPQLPWHVVLYNDDVHDMADVVLWVQKATGCNVDKAMQIMMEAHTHGRAIAYQGAHEDCERVCGSLRSHGLQAEIDTEGHG